MEDHSLPISAINTISHYYQTWSFWQDLKDVETAVEQYLPSAPQKTYQFLNISEGSHLRCIQMGLFSWDDGKLTLQLLEPKLHHGFESLLKRCNQGGPTPVLRRLRQPPDSLLLYIQSQRKKLVRFFLLQVKNTQIDWSWVLCTLTGWWRICGRISRANSNPTRTTTVGAT